MKQRINITPLISCSIITYEYAENLHQALSDREIDVMIDIRTLNCSTLEKYSSLLCGAIIFCCH